MPINTYGVLHEVIWQHPDWGICCQNIDSHLHYAYPSEQGWRVYQAAQKLDPLVTLADLTLLAATEKSYQAARQEMVKPNVDILLVSKREFYGTKGLILDPIAPNHYQVTELQPNALLIFLAGLKTLTISVSGNCVIVEDHAISEDSRPTQAGSG